MICLWLKSSISCSCDVYRSEVFVLQFYKGVVMYLGCKILYKEEFCSGIVMFL